MEVFNCGYCGKETERTVSYKKYCSRGCKEAAKNARARKREAVSVIFYYKICEKCGKYFTTEIENKRYCTKTCRNGVRSRDSGPKPSRLDHCECCGFNIPEALHAHHINRTKGLGTITLCANCHYIFHGVYGRKREEYERDSKAIIRQQIQQHVNR